MLQCDHFTQYCCMSFDIHDRSTFGKWLICHDFLILGSLAMAEPDFQFYPSVKSDVSARNLFTVYRFIPLNIRIYSIMMSHFILCLRQVHFTDKPSLARVPSWTAHRRPLSRSIGESMLSVVVGNLGAPLRSLFQDEVDETMDGEREPVHVMNNPFQFGLPIPIVKGVGIV